MIKADKWLLERIFEPAACEVESWTGVGPYRLARFFVLTQIVADATTAMREHTPHGYALFGLCLLAGACLAGMTFFAERIAKRRGVANDIKHSMGLSYVRLFELSLALISGLSCLLTGLRLTTVSLACSAAAWYFLSCDRLPPRERHVFKPVEAPSNAGA